MIDTIYRFIENSFVVAFYIMILFFVACGMQVGDSGSDNVITTSFDDHSVGVEKCDKVSIVPGSEVFGDNGIITQCQLEGINCKNTDALTFENFFGKDALDQCNNIVEPQLSEVVP